jgi:hypothetical protein
MRVPQSSLLEGWGLASKLEGGGVGEWLNPAVLKTVRPERVSGVRIPPPPPCSLAVSLPRSYLLSNINFAAQNADGGRVGARPRSLSGRYGDKLG